MGIIDRTLNKLFNRKEIHNCDGDVYLKRWFVIRNSYFALFIHKFVRSDEDRALHDHPWNFLVVPIWQGYIEHSVTKCRLCGVRHGIGPLWEQQKRIFPFISARYRSAEYRHRVELIDKRPSWSLFLRFRKRRVWGFWPEGGFVDNHKWWKDMCGDE